MPLKNKTKRRSIDLFIVATLATVLFGCQTPTGPHHRIPEQSLTIEKPEGLTRVIFLNTNYRSEGSGAGPIRIQLEGQQIPSLWAERYVQTFLEPGEYEVHLEQAGLVFWKASYQIDVEGDELLVSVYRPGFGVTPRLEILDKLPSDFDSAFRPGRHPDSW